MVTNTGTGTLTGATFSDPVPTGFNPTSYPGLSLSGGVLTGTIPSLGPGATQTYTVTGSVTGTTSNPQAIANTATVTVPSGPGNVGTSTSATDNDDFLSITKVDNHGGSSITGSIGTVSQGNTLVYTIVVTNTGTGTLTGAQFSDPVPTGFSPTSYPGLSLSGGVLTGTVPSLGPGGTQTYTVTGTVTGTNNSPQAIANTATVSVPSGPGNVGTSTSATDNDDFLSISKVDNRGGSSITGSVGIASQGDSLVYTITVTNTGTGTLTGATISDPVPAGFTPTSYPGLSLAGGVLTGTVPSLGPGGTQTYTVTGTLSSTVTGTLSNTPTVTVPPGTNNVGTSTSATDSDNIMTIFKSDSAGGSSNPVTIGNVTAGQTLTYTIIVSNTGTLPGSINGGTVSDPFPANFTATNYQTSFTGGASITTANHTATAINDTVVLPYNSTITYTVTGTVSSAATGTLVNTGTLSYTPPNGIPTSTTATDTDNVTPVISSLSGYVYVDSNNNGVKDSGEPPIAGVTVVLTGTPTGGSSITETTTTDSLGYYDFANLQPGNYTITETQPTNFIDGKVTVGSQNSGTIVQNTTTNLIQSITLGGGVNGINNNFGNLGLTPPYVSKRDYINPSNPPSMAAVETLSGYVYSETSAGSANYDPANPAAGETPLAGVTVTLSGTGGTQTTTTTAAGAYSFTNVQPGTYTLTETTPTGYTAQTTFVGTQGTGTAGVGTITSIKMISTAWGTGNDFPNLVQNTTFSIVKSDNAGGSSSPSTTGNVVPGQSLTYTIVATNTGSAAAGGVTISDPLPGNLTGASWTATQTGGATGFSASGTGNINDTSVTMPAGSTITYTVTGTISSSATGSLSNTATLTPTTGTAVSATDTDNLANLSITKTDNVGGSSVTGAVGDYTPPGAVTYTVTVSNTGSGNVTGATITDPTPAGVSSDTWTATETGNASGFSATGSGSIDDTNVSLPSGSTITYTITANLSGVESEGTVTNVGTVAPPVGTSQSATDVINVFPQDTVASAVASPAVTPAVASGGSSSSSSSSSTALNSSAVDAALAGANGGTNVLKSSGTGGTNSAVDAALVSW